MKNVYDLLNHIDININEIDEIEASELEKRRLKNSLRQQIQQQRKSFKWKKQIVAIAMTFSLLFLGVSLTSQAIDIPGFSNVFSFFMGEEAEDYQENATDVNQVAYSSGIEFTIDEIVYDGRTAFLTFQIQSEKELGPNPKIVGEPGFLHYGGLMDLNITRLTKNTYVGMATLSHSQNYIDESYIVWEPYSVTLDHQNNIHGDWYFKIPIKTTDNNIMDLDHQLETENVEVNMDQLVQTPMNSILYFDYSIKDDTFEQWDFKIMNFTVYDNLGNEYEWENKIDRGDKNRSYIGMLDKNPEATKLIIKPTLQLSMADNNNEDGSMSRSINSDEPQEVIELEEITIDLD
ncbi:DUF4179 domain-containing protein [Aquisalibacillus elongatus]|uniref:Uncharacterized protein DUF4179 n=1 Tax=Aquisalibacillus elongatus TaxID=485577 RepID=A0A3N5C4A8_9BACI|nr:DUF4179 domain-containing protein [Aquisalibacillus elongatus]RPF57068.1 uncharacterized protein DUF4179 [Aquisalibacillus elongatus]